MNEIPTAEEYFEQHQFELEDYDEGGYLGLNTKEGAKMLIEFAKIHVQAALKEATKEVKMKSSRHFTAAQTIDEDSILNAYPLSNIK